MRISYRQSWSFLRESFRQLPPQIEFGDVLIFFYALVFVRQYFWLVGNSFAWVLSVVATAVLWFLYVWTKPVAREKFGWSFWLLVGLPLLALFLLRAAFPDRSFDVLTYHVLHSERSLRGTLFRPGDYFPTASPYNPAPDTLMGLSQLLLGYRLGPAINLFALIWTAQIAYKILRPVLVNAWLRSASVLLVVLAENFFFEISTYMIDLLALPLLLQATLLILRSDKVENPRANYVHVALLLGASTAIKLTNLAVVLPLAAVCVYKLIPKAREPKPQNLAITSLLSLAAFLGPQLPFWVFMFRLTGNPLFPIANVFFKSPYWPTHGGWDARWGPQTFWEVLVWPVLIWFKPERYSELPVYSGRLSLGVIVALCGLLLTWRHRPIRVLCLVLVASSFLWSVAGLGYSRYGFYQELVAGITIIAVAFTLYSRTLIWEKALALLFFAALIIQSGTALYYARHHEWGQRATLIDDPGKYTEEAKLMLRDRSLDHFFSDRERQILSGVQVWLETCPESTAFEVLLNPQAPIIAARQPEYFFTRAARRRFIQTVQSASSQKMFSLCFSQSLDVAKQSVASRALEIANITPVSIPFFSPRDRIGMMLIEIRVPLDSEARSKFESSWMNAAFPDSDYREEITALNAPTVMKPGEKVSIRFKVKNAGYSTWPAVGNKEGRYQVNLRDRWLSADGRVEINGLDGGTGMPADLAPGNEVELPLSITAPRDPGEYIVEVDMVHEGVTWFYERGGHPLHLRVRVVP